MFLCGVYNYPLLSSPLSFGGGGGGGGGGVSGGVSSKGRLVLPPTQVTQQIHFRYNLRAREFCFKQNVGYCVARGVGHASWSWVHVF